jgi:RimJ/RimL family protein N-acetyltransferase/SAM-dependent methyltransferase
MNDAELLALRERKVGLPPQPWVGVTREGWLGPLDGTVSDSARAEARALLDTVPPSMDDRRPAVVEAVASLLEHELGELWFVGGPVWVIPPDLSHSTPDGVTIVTSADGPRTAELTDRRPLSWEPDEWMQLLRGELGPWAMAVIDDRVVSICHTPAMSDEAAECGTWTNPEYRGRGISPATVSAWVALVARPGRPLFYTTNDENVRSQRVASKLGLRLIGRRWPFFPVDWPEADAWGRALKDHHRTVWVPTPELESDDGQVGPAMHPEWFFRTHDQWDWWERDLLEAVTQGPVLDLGAGAGRVSLWLQDRGLDVTAVDSSPGAVAVCRARGVHDARIGDLNEPPDDKRWQTILLLCGNLGLGGSRDGTRALLTRLAQIAAKDAVLIGDTVDPNGPPEIGLRIRYRFEATPWWRQYNIPVNEIADLLDSTGWHLDRHIVDGSDHAVLLRRSD